MYHKFSLTFIFFLVAIACMAGNHKSILVTREIDGISYDYIVLLYTEDENHGNYDKYRYWHYNSTDGAYLVQMSHKPTSYVPDIARIPSSINVNIHERDTVGNDIYIYDVAEDCNVIISSMYSYSDSPNLKPASWRNFYTIDIDPDVNIVDWVLPVNAQEYTVEGGRGKNFLCGNGILALVKNHSGYDGYEIDDEYIVAVPSPFNNVAIGLPEQMENFASCGGYCNKLNVPVKFNNNLKRITGQPFSIYPFYGLEIPEYIPKRSYDLKITNAVSSLVKAFEYCNFSIPTDMAACILVDELQEVRYEDLFAIYDSSIYADLEYVQFDTSVAPKVIIPETIDSYSSATESSVGVEERKVITFVNPDLVETFRKMQKDGLFPQNADIKPKEDMIYLYPELSRGTWYGGRCQLVYALCRFGDSEVVRTEWYSSDPTVATVDEEGVVTAKSSGHCSVTFSVTDQAGEQKSASINLYPTDQIVASVTEFEQDDKISSLTGVFNLHGVYLGETTDGLPAGLYIANGKKVIVK